MGVALGIDPAKVRTSTEGAEFKLGTLGYEQESAGAPDSAMGVTGGSGSQDNSAKVYMYVEANEAITGDGYVCLVTGDTFKVDMADTTSSAPGTGSSKLAGVARAAIASGGFGWIQIFGAGLVRVAASAAAYTRLNTTGTGGQLDDDASVGAEVIDGIILAVARGGTAGTAAGFINYGAKVGATL